jgi:ABC-type multidrug transport system fused ATPase/permease subunit
VDRNLHRYIIRRSLRPQLLLIAIAFVLGLALNPFMLNLQKRIINEAIGQRNFEALLWLCFGFLGAVLANGALKYVKQNLEGYISETMLRDLRGELYNRILRFPLPHLKHTSRIWAGTSASRSPRPRSTGPCCSARWASWCTRTPGWRW